MELDDLDFDESDKKQTTKRFGLGFKSNDNPYKSILASSLGKSNIQSTQEPKQDFEIKDRTQSIENTNFKSDSKKQGTSLWNTNDPIVQPQLL